MTKHRKIWEDANGKLPHGYEVHHKVPVHAGGTDDISNLEPLTADEHAEAHLKRYHEVGDFRDLCAYHMITYNFTEAHRISSGEGGKIGGKIAKSKGVGIFRSEDDRKVWASMGGSAAQATLKERQTGAFYDPVLKRQISSNGGLASPAFRDPVAQSRRGKKGGATNTGTLWVTDGTMSFKFRPTENQPLNQFLLTNPQLRAGRHYKPRKKEST